MEILLLLTGHHYMEDLCILHTFAGDPSNYNRMENGFREPPVVELQKLSKLCNITVDELINPEEVTPREVVIEDKRCH